jgi:hypothetical protein
VVTGPKLARSCRSRALFGWPWNRRIGSRSSAHERRSDPPRAAPPSKPLLHMKIAAGSASRLTRSGGDSPRIVTALRKIGPRCVSSPRPGILEALSPRQAAPSRGPHWGSVA